MKKNVLIATMLAFALSGFAQDKAIKQNGFGDNWFIQGQIGAEYTFSEYSPKANFGDLITPHAAVSVGKHFAPQVGARLQVGGWLAKSFNEPTNHHYKVKYIQTNVDGLLNLTNLFSPYTEGKRFNLYAIAGLGYVHGFKNSSEHLGTTNMIVPRGGFQADYMLNNNLSLNLEAIGNLMRDDFNGKVDGVKYDGTVNLLAGITYHFNKSGFELSDGTDPELLRSLNDQINQQRALIADKNKLVKDLETALANQKPVVETKEVKGTSETVMNAVVVFHIGSAKLEKNQDINIYNAAKYLQENPNVNIILTGYADKSTGTKAINQALSEKRAKAVHDVLVNKHNISPSRITTVASGDTVQPFPTDAWNRVVIFTAK